MADPGYGPNGERRSASGLVVWEAVAPFVEQPEGDDVWSIYALGETFIPALDQSDDEAWTAIELEVGFPVATDNLTWDATDNLTWDASDNVTWN